MPPRTQTQWSFALILALLRVGVAVFLIPVGLAGDDFFGAAFFGVGFFGAAFFGVGFFDVGFFGAAGIGGKSPDLVLRTGVVVSACLASVSG